MTFLSILPQNYNFSLLYEAFESCGKFDTERVESDISAGSSTSAVSSKTAGSLAKKWELTKVSGSDGKVGLVRAASCVFY